MQPLYLVGFTSDLSGLIFRTRESGRAGGFVVDVDDRLLGQIEELMILRDEALPPALRNGGDHRGDDHAQASSPPGRTRRQSRLTPREIQDRLRSGHSIPEVAAEAGVEEEWVSRFAAPVQAKLAQVIDRALQLTYNRPGFGPSAQPLAKSVAHNLAERKGASLAGSTFEDAWSAYQRVDELWVVCFSFVARRRVQPAEWIVDLNSGTLRAFNKLAEELGHLELFNRREMDGSDDAGAGGNGGQPELREGFLRRRPAG